MKELQIAKDSKIRSLDEELGICSKQNQDLRDQLNQNAKEMDTFRAAIAEKEEELQALKKKHVSMIQRKDEIIENLKKSAKFVKGKLSKLEHSSTVNMDDLSQRLNDSFKENEVLLSEVNEYLDENAKLKEQIVGIGSMNKGLIRNSKHYERKMNEFEQAMREKSIAMELLQNEMNLVQNNSNKVKHEWNESMDRIQSLKMRVVSMQTAMNEECDGLRSENKQLMAALNNSQSERDNVDSEISSLRKVIKSQNADLSHLRASRQTFREKLRAIDGLSQANDACKAKMMQLNEEICSLKASKMQNEKRVDGLKEALREKDDKMREMRMKWMRQKQELKHEIVVNQTEKNQKIYELQKCVAELKGNNARIVSLENDIFALQYELKSKRESGLKIDELAKEQLRKSRELKREWTENMNQQCVDDEIAYLDDDILRLKAVLNAKQEYENGMLP